MTWMSMTLLAELNGTRLVQIVSRGDRPARAGLRGRTGPAPHRGPGRPGAPGDRTGPVRPAPGSPTAVRAAGRVRTARSPCWPPPAASWSRRCWATRYTCSGTGQWSSSRRAGSTPSPGRCCPRSGTGRSAWPRRRVPGCGPARPRPPNRPAGRPGPGAGPGHQTAPRCPRWRRCTTTSLCWPTTDASSKRLLRRPGRRLAGAHRRARQRSGPTARCSPRCGWPTAR